MKEITFRKLRADEIQVRPTDTKTKGKALLLLYQDARCAMNILDESVGQYGWQKDFKEINGNIYCGIGILNQQQEDFKPLGFSPEWVWKWDAGAFTANDEDMQSKADASDATKRAAVCWGIGRELYATPKIRINCPDSYYYNDKLTMTFSVKSIEWDGDKLVDLIIIDRYGKEVYNFKNGNEQPAESKPVDNATILKEFCSSKKGTVDTDTLKEFFNYWNNRIEKGDFKGKMNPESLWNKHITRKAA